MQGKVHCQATRTRSTCVWCMCTCEYKWKCARYHLNWTFICVHSYIQRGILAAIRSWWYMYMYSTYIACDEFPLYNYMRQFSPVSFLNMGWHKCCTKRKKINWINNNLWCTNFNLLVRNNRIIKKSYRKITISLPFIKKNCI